MRMKNDQTTRIKGTSQKRKNAKQKRDEGRKMKEKDCAAWKERKTREKSVKRKRKNKNLPGIICISDDRKDGEEADTRERLE